MNRSIIVIISFAVVFSIISAEPVRYYRQPFRASARQTNNGLAFEAGLSDLSTSTTTTTAATPEQQQNEDEERSEQTTENAPYKLAGWRPSGQLLVLPFDVRANQNLESTTADDEPISTTENPTTEKQANGEQLELESSEPKTKTAAYKRPPLKVSGALIAEVSDDSSESNSEATSTITESSDESETTTVFNGALETTSEPNSEAVDVENTKSENPAPNQQPQLPQGPFQPAFFVQLPDGSYQRIIYFPAQPPSVQPEATANIQFQQLVQPQVTPFGFNPITNPRIVTFSSQYQAF